MSNGTEKHTCNVTCDEIVSVIEYHAKKLADGSDIDYAVERINYLNKRLRDIKAKEAEVVAMPTAPAAKGWGT
jgi:hypothetical protein